VGIQLFDFFIDKTNKNVFVIRKIFNPVVCLIYFNEFKITKFLISNKNFHPPFNIDCVLTFKLILVIILTVEEYERGDLYEFLQKRCSAYIFL